MRISAVLALLAVVASTSLADTVFHCRMNAIASRDFRTFGEPAWCAGMDNCGLKAGFGVKLFAKPSFGEPSYREFLISLKEGSEIVTLKSFWSTDEDGKPLSEEFDARVVSRVDGVTFFVYLNPTTNKVHSYAIDSKHKKLVTTSVMRGMTSLVAEAKTYDCE